MDLAKTLPLRYWINIGRRDDRRGETEFRLQQVGLTAQRYPAVDARFVARMALERNEESADRKVVAIDNADAEHRDRAEHFPVPVRGYESAGRYALALTQRMAVRQASLKKAEAVLLLEDDVVFHPNFRALIGGIDVPDDWGILYLGCQHLEEPFPAAAGTVKVKHCVDTHAVAIRRPYYRRVIEALNAHGKPTPRHPLASDRFLAALQGEIPTYACFPNLAWQANSASDLVHTTYTLYQRGGTQKQGHEYIERTFANMSGTNLAMPGAVDPKLGLLFLTRKDVNHPEIWREFVSECPDGVRVFSHPKSLDAVKGGFLDGSPIRDRFDTAWGAISLVRASLALLRRALEDDALTHFVLLSESCVPIRTLSGMLRHLQLNPRSRFGSRTLDKCWDMQQSRASHLPQIPAECWRFQAQWWLMERMAAEWVARADYTAVFSRMPVPDEAYFATALSLLGYPVDDRVVDKDITWTNWEKDHGSPTSYKVVRPETVQAMVESQAWFARKFPVGSDVGKWGLHRI